MAPMAIRPARVVVDLGHLVRARAVDTDVVFDGQFVASNVLVKDGPGHVRRHCCWAKP